MTSRAGELHSPFLLERKNKNPWRRYARGHRSSTHVSFVPPPCDEFTTSEPSLSATRVRPPGTKVTSRPDSTKGRRSICLGAMPASTKVGQADNAKVGCAMYFSGERR